MFGVTAGYHRYFSHRSYKLGAGARSSRWRAWRRAQGRRACCGGRRIIAITTITPTRPDDVHSPREGFWWAHVGWILSERTRSLRRRSHRGLRAAIRNCAGSIGITGCRSRCSARACGSPAGPAAFVWGVLLSTVALYHATFAINSVAHVWGTRAIRRPATTAATTSCWRWSRSAKAGTTTITTADRVAGRAFDWWEIDVTYLALRGLAAIGIARDLRPFVVRPARRAA